MKKTILVVGGAGYIGSHTAYLLAQEGYKVIILDALLQHQPFNHQWATLIRADFSDHEVLKKIFSTYFIDTVMHFAAFIEVGESVERPADFYQNNVVKTLQLLDMMRLYEVRKMIFSSSCAVYGNPLTIPMREDHPTNPISPYGKNKLMVEFVLHDYAAAYGLQYVALRYFNAAGALAQQYLGEWHEPESHLIPRLCRAAMEGTTFSVLGKNYPTIDGTCVRDYVHVLDIAKAHVNAMRYLTQGGASTFFNLGTGTGYTVQQVIDTAQRVWDRSISYMYTSPRPGDVQTLVADPTKALSLLNWQPAHSALDHILATAWQWELFKKEKHQQSGVAATI